MPYLKYYDVVKYPDEIACMCLPYLKTTNADKGLDHLAVISITSNVECCLGIIACSLPPLRKLFRFYYGSSRDNYQITDEASIA